MTPFVTHQGLAAPLLRSNVDTDAIIPSREMRRVSKQGLGEGLFAGWRYLDTNQTARKPNPEFVLNQAQYAGATILLAGNNFGCGSSREHAVWALLEYGFRAVLAPGFGSIFYHNAVRNGLLPVRLPESAILRLSGPDEGPPAGSITIDLQECTVSNSTGLSYRFDIEPAYRDMLLAGMDAIDVTLQHQEHIDAFQAKDRKRRDWAYLR